MTIFTAILLLAFGIVAVLGDVLALAMGTAKDCCCPYHARYFTLSLENLPLPEIIGESLSQAETENPELPALIPDVRRIVVLRNRIIHGYDSVDDELLWQTIQTHVPPLAQHLAQLLESDKD